MGAQHERQILNRFAQLLRHPAASRGLHGNVRRAAFSGPACPHRDRRWQSRRLPGRNRSDDTQRLLDPEEGRRSFQRRLRQAETAKPGHVADAEGMPIAGATVKRSDSAWSATTDASGAFPLPELKPGEQAQLHVSARGFLRMENAYLSRTAEGQDHPAASGRWYFPAHARFPA